MVDHFTRFTGKCYNLQFSVQNLGDGHSISSTKSRRGKRALHEILRQMRKAKSEKQNPNK